MIGIVITGIITLFLLLKHYFKAKRLPPGPLAFPILGNLPQIIVGSYRLGGVVPLLQKWQAEYGDVFTWWPGPFPAVNFCSFETASEAMITKGAVFNSRKHEFILNVVREDRGIIVANGQHWAEQRKFSIHTLKNLGVGRNLMQERIMLEFDYRALKLDKLIEDAGGRYSFHPWSFIELTVGNIINQMLFSERFTDCEEDEFFRLKRAMDRALEEESVLDFMINEWSLIIPPFKKRYDDMANSVKDTLQFIQRQIDKRKAEISSGEHDLRDEGEDVVDSFLLEMRRMDVGNSFNDQTLPITLMDLWVAAQETTVTTINWGLVYLVMNPEVKKRLCAELDSITGGNRRLHLADKPKTVYFNATLTEILRLSAIVPVNLSRESAHDTQIGEYFIPQGTAITVQLAVIMSDKRTFNEPEKESNLMMGKNIDFSLNRNAFFNLELIKKLWLLDLERGLILGNLLLSYDIREDPALPASVKAKSEMGNMRRAEKYHVIIAKRN